MTNQFGKKNLGDPGEGSARRRPRVRPKPNQSQPPNTVEGGRFAVPDGEEAHAVGWIDPKKRSIALIFDIIAGFCIALLASAIASIVGLLLASLLPGLSRVLSMDVFIVAFFLIRDHFYQGRGFGKNLMGLRVVDVETNEGPSLSQSIKRNLIFVIPFLLKFSIELASPFIPGSELRMAVLNVVYVACTLYVIVLIPLECYKAYNAAGGRRFGDIFAGTKVVESELNFSSPLK